MEPESSREEWCDRFTRTGNMFIRGVNYVDAERLWDFALSIGVPGWLAMTDAAIREETPDEWIEVWTVRRRAILLGQNQAVLGL